MTHRLVILRTLYHQHKVAIATATATVGFVTTSDTFSNDDIQYKAFAESAAASPLGSLWGWTRRLTGRSWQEKVGPKLGEEGGEATTTTTTQGSSHHDPKELFEGQCLKRQLYTPRVPYPAWDYNWDGRMTEKTSMVALAEHASSVNNTAKTRHIILVRHGQYDERPRDDVNQRLTAVGRQQAKKTGQRLAAMAKGSTKFKDKSLCGTLPISKIRVSNMTRAKETALLIAQEMKKQNVTVQLEQPDPSLNEALPAPMIPSRPDMTWAEEEIDYDKERVEEAFQKYFYRQDQENEEGDEELDDFEIVVCHGNLIRYFFCRALQIPPEVWLRMSIYNCSMTYLTIRPDGKVTARMLGDIGHLDYEESTYSGYFGFKW